MNGSTVHIIRKLPPAPRTATKTVHDNRFLGDGIYIYKFRAPIPVMKGETSTQACKRVLSAARGRREGKAEKKHDEVRRLAEEGVEYAEIAERTGYKVDSVRRMVRRMRHDGADIPARKRGRKSGKSSNSGDRPAPGNDMRDGGHDV